MEDSPGLEDSPAVEVQGMVVGGLSTAGVEVEAGRLWAEGALQSVVRDSRRAAAGPV